MSGQFSRAPMIVIGPNDEPTESQALAAVLTRDALVGVAMTIMRGAKVSALTAHTLLFQQIALALADLDAAAADDFIDAMRRNLAAARAGAGDSVSLAEMADAAQRLEDAFELITRNDAGRA